MGNDEASAVQNEMTSENKQDRKETAPENEQNGAEKTSEAEQARTDLHKKAREEEDVYRILRKKKEEEEEEMRRLREKEDEDKDKDKDKDKPSHRGKEPDLTITDADRDPATQKAAFEALQGIVKDGLSGAELKAVEADPMKVFDYIRCGNRTLRQIYGPDIKNLMAGAAVTMRNIQKEGVPLFEGTPHGLREVSKTEPSYLNAVKPYTDLLEEQEKQAKQKAAQQDEKDGKQNGKVTKTSFKELMKQEEKAEGRSFAGEQRSKLLSKQENQHRPKEKNGPGM